LVVFTILFLIVLSGVFLWFRSFATQSALKDLENDLRATAITAAAGIDGDEHQRLFESGQIDDPTYLKINAFLRQVKKTNPKASGIYTYVQNPTKPDEAQFVVSAALPPGVILSDREQKLINSTLTDCNIRPETRPLLGAPFRPTEEGYTAPMAQGLRDAAIDPVPYPDDWGLWISGAAPIYNSKGEAVGAVGVDMCYKEVVAIQQRITNTLVPVFGIIVLALALAVFFIAHSVTRPIIALTHAADQIGHGNYNAKVNTDQGKIRDEVDSLANVFSFMVDKVREREQNLKSQVAELQIIVDEGKRKQQVDEIVDSEFFRSLQAKAREARSRRDRSGPTPEPT
jgi:HAMP domain-containing protein